MDKLITFIREEKLDECINYIREFVKKDNVLEYLEYLENVSFSNDTLKEVIEILEEINSSLLISLTLTKDEYIKKIDDKKIINLTGQSGSGKSTYAINNFSSSNYLIVDTDEIFSNDRFINSTGINKELGEYFRDKYSVLPELGKDFDLIYSEILEFCEDKEEIIVVDCAQFHLLKDISILRGTVIVIRTDICTCYERCIERYKKLNSSCSSDDILKYSIRKKGMFKWYKSSNNFIEKVDSL